jgi:hypothetical protein
MAEWTPFQTHYFSENLVAPGMEPGPLDPWPGTLTTRPVVLIKANSGHTTISILSLRLLQGILFGLFSWDLRSQTLYRLSSLWCMLHDPPISFPLVQSSCVGYEMLTAVAMNSILFWDVTACGPLKVSWLVGWRVRVSQSWNHHEADSKESVVT